MTDESLFNAALEKQSPAERNTFLDGACGNDTALRQRIDELLRCHVQAGRFLQRPAVEQLERTPEMADEKEQPEPPTTTLGAGTDSVPGRPTDDDGSVLRMLGPANQPGSLGRVRHFEILEVVGKGGFGTVLKGFDDRLHRVVAIKVLAPELAVNGTSRQRFLREARAAAAVQHDNVIGIHDVAEEPFPHFVMAYIDGQNLHQKLNRCGALPIADILRIGLQVAEALAAAHKQGLIHRDVKPSNILLENGVERVKLSDFGLARAVDDASLTQSGQVAGTPQFMSPEQAEAQHVDQRSDLFSLGCVLYVMCTGRPPFRGDSSLAVLRQVCEATPRPIRECNPVIPEWLAGVVDTLLAKKPEDRIQSADQLAQTLAQFLSQLQRGVQAPVKLPAPSSKPRRVTRHPRTVTIGLSLVVLVSCLTAWLFWASPWQSVPAPESLPPGRQAAIDHAPLAPGYDVTLPRGADLADRASPADALDRQQISPEFLRLLFPNPAAPPPPGLVAVLGDDRLQLPRQDGFVMRADHGPDGKLLAVPKGTDVLIYELPSGKCQRRLPGPGGSVRRVVFSPDGQLLAAVTLDDTTTLKSFVRVWDLEKGWEVLDRLQPPQVSTGSSCIVFSANGKQLITSGDTGQPLYVADARTGVKVREINRGPQFIPFVARSGNLLAVADWNSRQVVLWDTDLWEERKTFERSGDGIGDVAVSPDGKQIALGSDNDIKLCDVETGNTIHTFNTAGHRILFAPNGKTMLNWGTLVPAKTHSVNRWDVERGVNLGHFEVTGPEEFFFPWLSRDGSELYIGYQHGQLPYIRVIDAVTGRERPYRGHAGAVKAVAVSPDGRRLASAGADRTVRLWDLAGGQLCHTLNGHEYEVWTVAFSPNGQLVASGSADGTIILWDVESGKEVNKLTDRANYWVRQLAFTPDGDRLVAGSQLGNVRVWNARSAGFGGDFDMQHKFTGDGACWSLAISPDGKTLAAGFQGGTIQLWDCITGLPAGEWAAHRSGVRSLAFRPGGDELASSGDDSDPTVKIWEVAGHKQKACLEGHTSAVVCSVWRADGAQLITCGAKDHVVRLWDMAGQPPKCNAMPLALHGEFLEGIALTPEGRYLATANPDGTIFVIKLAERAGPK